jgi:hypothetical protein
LTGIKHSFQFISHNSYSFPLNASLYSSHVNGSNRTELLVCVNIDTSEDISFLHRWLLLCASRVTKFSQNMKLGFHYKNLRHSTFLCPVQSTFTVFQMDLKNKLRIILNGGCSNKGIIVMKI